MKLCDVKGCDRPARYKGIKSTVGRPLCDAHNLRWHRLGDVKEDMPIQFRPSRPWKYPKGLRCKIRGCGRPVKCKYMCEAHYCRKKRGYSLEHPIRKVSPR